jgi:outer membrane protein assembly factor BamB
LRLTPLVLAFLLVAPPALGQAWSQGNADPANTGRLDRAGPTSLEEAQFTPVDDQVLTQVTEGPAGLALAGSLGGTVYAVDASGEVVWQADVGDEIRTAPLWTGEVVVVAPRGDRVHAFTPEGEEAWTVPIANDRGATLVRMASPVEHPSGDVIVGTMDGTVHRLTPQGSTVWMTTIGEDDAVEATPAITPGGDVIAAAFEPGREGRGFLARLDADTGERTWQLDIGSQVVGAPAVVADTVLVPLRDGNAVQARSLSDGSLIWETAFDSRVPASPSLHEGLAIVGDIRGTVRALEVSGGKIAWEFNPLSDDPDVELGGSGRYTIADSLAVDDEGVAWVPYWVFEAGCCPPSDSVRSPIYRLDADDGEILDRRSDAKANHGPALHTTGVWTGSDEQGVRSFPLDPSLQLDARTDAGQARLIVNTDATGDWRIATGDRTLDEGQGRPPTVSGYDLDPGQHNLTVTVDDLASQATVEIEADDGDDDPARPEDQDPSAPADEAEPEPEPSSEDEEPNTSEGGAEDPQPAPLAAWAAWLAIGLAAGVRRRA